MVKQQMGGPADCLQRCRKPVVVRYGFFNGQAHANIWRAGWLMVEMKWNMNLFTVFFCGLALQKQLNLIIRTID